MPTIWRRTSWLFLYNAVEELNLGLPRTNPDRSRVEDLNHGPPDFKSSSLNHLANALSNYLTFKVRSESLVVMLLVQKHA